MSKRPATPDEMWDASHPASRGSEYISATSLPSETHPETFHSMLQNQARLVIEGSSMGSNKGGMAIANAPNMTVNEPTFTTTIIAEELMSKIDMARRIYEWLQSGPDGDLSEASKTRHRNLLDDYMAETGSEFLESAQLQAWMNDSSAPGGMFDEHRFLLWCYGDAGVGKSTIFSQVANRLQARDASHDKQCVIYLYCDFERKEYLNHRSLLKWALMQAMEQIRRQTSKTPEELQEAWMQNQGPTAGLASLHPSDAQTLLTKLLKRYFDRCFILIDGLDEYVDDTTNQDAEHDKGTALFDSIYNVARVCEGRCRVLVTSRPQCERAHGGERLGVTYHMVSAKDDMSLYIKRSLDNYKLKDQLLLSPKLQEKIEETLAESPSFLILKLRWRSIQRLKTLKNVRESLDNLPKTLHEMYQREWNRLQAQDHEKRDLAKTIIGIVFHARRVLSLEELAHVMATQAGDERFDHECMMAYDELIAHTMGFLKLEPHTPDPPETDSPESHSNKSRSTLVRFYHLTARQYLGSIINQDEVTSKIEERLARTCITQLKFKDFEHACTMEELKHRCKNFPFWEYSAEWAGSHICSWLRINPGQATEVKSIIDAEIPLGSWQVLAAKVLQYPEAPRIPGWLDKITALQRFIVLDADYIVDDMLSQSEHASLLESRGFKDETPLHTAARVGSVACVKVLLKHGASVNAKNASGKNALDMIMLRPWQQHQAMFTESDGQLLFALVLYHLKRGLDKTRLDDDLLNDVRTASEKGERAADPFSPERMRMEHEGHARMTRLVLGSGVKLNISEEEAEIVDMLLVKDIELNNTKGTEATALQLATLYGRSNLVVKLLEKGANPFLKKALGYTAVEIAEEKRSTEMEEVLRAKMSELDRLEELESDKIAKRGIHGRTEADEIDRLGLVDRYRTFDEIPFRIAIRPVQKHETT